MSFRDKDNDMRMSETDLYTPILKLVNDNPGCDITFLIENLPKYLTLFPGDKKVSHSRAPELKYCQTVRNIVSHRKNRTNYFYKGVQISVLSRGNYTFNITDYGKGLIALENNEKIVEMSQDYYDDLSIIDSEPYEDLKKLEELNNRLPEKNDNKQKGRAYKTDPRISKTALVLSNYECEYAKALSVEHKTFLNPKNRQYVEAHHLIPMKAQVDFPEVNLDRTENIVALCPNCHRAIHLGNLEEKRKILKVLYDLRINKLKNSDERLYISFEELITKYY